jgi:hypothetical protein
LNVHPATSAHGLAEGANQLLQHQTVLPDIASAISLIFISAPSRRAVEAARRDRMNISDAAAVAKIEN